MSVLPLLEWIQGTEISEGIRGSFWIFAVVQALHLVTLSMLAGSILIVDLRLLGRGITEQPVKVVAQDAQPWLIAALFGMLLTGVPQFISDALKGVQPSLLQGEDGIPSPGAPLHVHPAPQRHAGGRWAREACLAHGRGHRVDRAMVGRGGLGPTDRIVLRGARCSNQM